MSSSLWKDHSTSSSIPIGPFRACCIACNRVDAANGVLPSDVLAFSSLSVRDMDPFDELTRFNAHAVSSHQTNKQQGGSIPDTSAVVGHVVGNPFVQITPASPSVPQASGTPPPYRSPEPSVFQVAAS